MLKCAFMKLLDIGRISPSGFRPSLRASCAFVLSSHEHSACSTPPQTLNSKRLIIVLLTLAYFTCSFLFFIGQVVSEWKVVRGRSGGIGSRNHRRHGGNLP